MPALLVKLSYCAHIMLTSLSVLCIYACAVCVAMSDIDTDGAIGNFNLQFSFRSSQLSKTDADGDIGYSQSSTVPSDLIVYFKAHIRTIYRTPLRAKQVLHSKRKAES